MASESASLLALDEHGRGLRVQFTRTADRFAHAVDAFHGEQATRLLESVEGAPDDPWPPSPALQGLNIEDLESDAAVGRGRARGRAGCGPADGKAGAASEADADAAFDALDLGPTAAAGHRSVRPAMLIGLAGTAHWSLSVEAAGAGLTFDAACRYKEAAGPLGSRYRVSYTVMAAEKDGGVELHFGWGRCRLRAEPTERDTGAPVWRLERGEEDATLACSPEAIARPPATVRWKYVLEMLL